MHLSCGLFVCVSVGWSVCCSVVLCVQSVEGVRLCTFMYLCVCVCVCVYVCVCVCVYVCVFLSVCQCLWEHVCV